MVSVKRERNTSLPDDTALPADASPAELLGYILQLRARAAAEIARRDYGSGLRLANEAHRAGASARFSQRTSDAGQGPLLLAAAAADLDTRVAEDLARIRPARLSGLQRAVRTWADGLGLIALGEYAGAAEGLSRVAPAVVDALSGAAVDLSTSARVSERLALVLLGREQPAETDQLALLIGPGGDQESIAVESALFGCPHGKASYDGTCMARPPCPPL
jgi:hypothetical protein